MTATTFDSSRLTARQMLNSTVYFWVIEVRCTTVGETASYYLSDNVGLGLTKTRFITGALLLATSPSTRAQRGRVSYRHDPMDAIEDALRYGNFHEIILSTLPHSVSRWLHVDLPHRVAHLGLPLTTLIAKDYTRPASTEDNVARSLA